ncbi:PilZ domain-containing protein [Oleiharenicola lentus]|uniref:PilZ domain-containing protein n=1 Tax=Oleiharenicola lentus TaxID=2508720 RepID=A0A4Q1C9E2_9BACT|nr:PilZ domain-containing protein [Oleiharenicola lentus]RXK55496.1 PilZ domain-containing protein [Oleiharenicola lentus]
MLLFRRIFNFEKPKVEKLADLRLNQRYAPGAAFPLQAWLIGPNFELPGKVENLSGNGLGLLTTDHDSGLRHGQGVKVRLALADFQLTLSAKIAHLRPVARGQYCGLGLQFGDFLEQKSWLQLLQPVAIGQSLRGVPPERVAQNEPQFIKQVFRGEENSALTVWLEKSFGTPLHSFEFETHDYFCRADAKLGVLEAYVREATDSHKGKLSNPVFDTSGGLNDEIRQLFLWILPNLSREVPDDVRAFLQRFAA